MGTPNFIAQLRPSYSCVLVSSLKFLLISLCYINYLNFHKINCFLVHIIGLAFMSSDQTFALQSPTVRKCYKLQSIIITFNPISVKLQFWILHPYFWKRWIPLKCINSSKVCLIYKAYSIFAFIFLIAGKHISY